MIYFKNVVLYLLLEGHCQHSRHAGSKKEKGSLVGGEVLNLIFQLMLAGLHINHK